MKFTIVTPCLNAEAHIAETIDSVIRQRGEFSIQYLIVDGGSDDGTEAIVKAYQERLSRSPDMIRCADVTLDWSSQQDAGMYEALNRGFGSAEGDVLAWINADDLYLPSAFDTVSRVFAQRPEVAWLKGVTDYINQASAMEQAGSAHLYQQDWLREGVYGRELQFVQQDSVFWRASLWQQAGGFPSGLRLAGDYWLWTRFARETPLYSLPVQVSCFRRQPGQLSEDGEGYRREMASVSPQQRLRPRLAGQLFALDRSLPRWLYQPFCRWLTGDSLYHAVNIGADGRVETLSGDYAAIRRALSGARS